MKNVVRLTPLALALLTAACTTDQMLMQNRVDYRTMSSNLSKGVLEVPPDLTPVANNPAMDIPTRSIITAGEIAGSARQLLPSVDRAKLMRDGNQHWLVLQVAPEQAWPIIKQFWQESGFKIVTDKPDAGLLETDWQQNNAKMEQGFFSSLLGRKVATAERDSFRMRIERNASGCDIFISHRGLVEGGMIGPNWRIRPNDPELEASMLALLLQKFGLNSTQAETVVKTKIPDQAQFIKQGTDTLLEVNDEFDRAWRRLGLAIERAGYEVVDRNRSEGSFIVRKAGADMEKKEEEGFFSKLAFWRDSKQEKENRAEYTLLLKQVAQKSTVSAKARDAAASGGEATLLDALLTQLR